MTGPLTTDTSSLAAARRHRMELLAAIQGFERAIAAPARDPRWRELVTERLRALREAFGEHVVVTEGPEGLYAELLAHAPRLASGVDTLVREHGQVLAALDRLYQRVSTMDIERIRAKASDRLLQLARHRQRGADLVYEAYATDIGGET